MLPTAGLFLPETLHRRDASLHTEGEGARLSFFTRQSARSKQTPREQGNTSPSIAETSSSEDIPDDYPLLNVAVEYADFVSSSSKPSAESASFAVLIHRVRDDVNEASRLYLSPTVKNFLNAWPDKRSYIDIILHDVRRTLNDIGLAIGTEGGTTGIRKKFEWVLGHPKKLSAKQQLLASCHQSLMTAIGIMQTVELCGANNGMWQDPIYEAPVQPWIQREDSHLMRGPYSRRGARLGQRNLTSSSVNLVPSEKDSMYAHSIESAPAELPGSTPDDLAHPNNMDLYSAPEERTAHNQIMDDSSSLNECTRIRHSLPDRSSRRSSVQGAGSPLRPTQNLSNRRSLDQVASSAPKSPERLRASLDSTKLPSRTQDQPAPAPLPIQPAPATTPLATVPETNFERNDSINSVGVIVTTPRVARRHQPTSVYIRRSLDRCHSLPNVLPPFQSQSSLTEDLANWIAPSPSSETLQSAEWTASPDSLSSPNSLLASPADTTATANNVAKRRQYERRSNEKDIAETETESENEAEVMYPQNHPASSSPRRSEELFFAISGIPSTHMESETSPKNIVPSRMRYRHRKSSASSNSIASSISRKPLPKSTAVNSSISTPLPASSPTPSSQNPPVPSPEQTSSSVSLEASSPHDDDSSSGSSTTIACIPDTGASTTPVGSATPCNAVVDDAELSLLQQKMLDQSYVKKDIKSVMGAESRQDSKIDDDIRLSDDSKQEKTSDESQSSEGTQSKVQSEEKITAAPSAADYIPPTAEVQTDKTPELSNNDKIVVEIPPLQAPQPPVPAKPMTAQAKRRAAHQRRMELAFGNDV